MEFAKIGILTLNLFDKNNLNCLEFLKKLCHDDTIQTRFQGITVGLLNNPNKEFFDHGFLVSHNNQFVGYVGIGKYDFKNKNVYLRAAIDKDKRGNSYGKTLLYEVSEYIFKNYPQVENICIKITNDNKPSLKMARACGYIWVKDDFYIKYNPYIDNIKIK